MAVAPEAACTSGAVLPCSRVKRWARAREAAAAAASASAATAPASAALSSAAVNDGTGAAFAGVGWGRPRPRLPAAAADAEAAVAAGVVREALRPLLPPPTPYVSNAPETLQEPTAPSAASSAAPMSSHRGV